ncbi:MAG TPA: hypothetical protein VH142_14060 [Polyangiaceae bacterium]|nr:hypothetical protein [Polyangiaceae bacterium]
MHPAEKTLETGNAEMTPPIAATDSAAHSPTAAARPLRVDVVRHLADDIARAVEEGDTGTAHVLAKGLAELLDLSDAAVGDVIDLAAMRRRKT